MTDESNKTKGDYEVGYGKPPEEHQFPKGKSGNPKGRPKKDNHIGGVNGWHPTPLWPATTDSLRIKIIDEMERQIPVKEQGRVSEIDVYTALIRSIIQKALKGDHRSQKLLVEMHSKSVEVQEQEALKIMEMLNEIDAKHQQEAHEILEKNRDKIEALRKKNLEEQIKEEGED